MKNLVGVPWILPDPITADLFAPVPSVTRASFTKTRRSPGLNSIAPTFRSYSSFPLIQPSFVKSTQLAQFDKTIHAW